MGMVSRVVTRDISDDACLPFMNVSSNALVPELVFWTYVWQAAICALADLWLVGVDENLWVP